MNKRLNIEKTQAALQAKGLSQTALANELGVSKEAVSQWLKEKSFPRPNKLLQLGKLLGLSFAELVIKDEENTPVVAFRKVGRAVTKNHHIEKAQEIGRFLRHLVPYLPFDTLEMPPVLKSPSCDYEFLQRVSEKVRSDINVSPDETIDFTHLIKRFSELQAVIVPVLWGSKNRHENAIHIYLPDSQTTWVYLNLDVNIHDFKFWMAHELGHCLSPSLTGTDEAEDFADSFAGALLFPEKKAKRALEVISSKPTVGAKISSLLKIAEDELISPYTVFLQVNSYARHIGQPEVNLGKGYYAAITKFNNQFMNLSEILLGDLSDITPNEYLHKVSDSFDTPFFNVLGEYLRDANKGSGYVQTVTDMPLLDARGIHAELT